MTRNPNLNAPLDAALARAALAALDAAVDAGARYLARGEYGRSAVTEAARALGLRPVALKGRAVAAVRAHGLSPRHPLPPGWLEWADRERDRSRGQARKARAAAAEAPSRQTVDPTDRRVTALADEVSRLRAALKKGHRQALDDDAMRQILSGLAAAPADPPRWLAAPERPASTAAPTPQVPVLMLADWHLGEVVAAAETHGVNAYSVAIAEERARRVVERAIGIAREHGPRNYPGAVIPLMGDFVSGGLHPELQKTDELHILPSIMRAADLLQAALLALADAFGRLYVPCVCGNHGRMTKKPEFKKYTAQNADFAVYELLRQRLAGDARIRIDHRPENDMHWRIYGLRFAQTHGDMLGVKGGDGIIGAMGPIMRGEIKAGKQMAAIGRDYDIMLMGHWHQMLWLPRAIVANTLKGWDEFAAKALRAPPSPPSQPLFFVHPRYGVTSKWEVKADAHDVPQAQDWVSWRPE